MHTLYRRIPMWATGLVLAAGAGCGDGGAPPGDGAGTVVTLEHFGTTPEGAAIDLYTLTNANGLTAQVTNYGAVWVSLRTPDRTGRLEEVTLGYDNLDGYVEDRPYLGATVGRVVSTISNARFELNGVTVELSKRPGGGHSHGGIQGFNKRVWAGEATQAADGAGVRFTRVSADGEEGYPGNLSVAVTYTLTSDDALRIEYTATTDAPTVVNLTNHAYFNLAGPAAADVLGHVLTIDADRYLDDGAFHDVEGTPLDFRQAAAIGARIDRVPGGYDLAYALNNDDGSLAQVATAYEPGSGRVMEVWTTEPSLVLYTANYLDGSMTGRGGRPLGHRQGFCFEAEHFPDSPNHPEFPSVVLNPGETYTQTTVYRFSTR